MVNACDCFWTKEQAKVLITFLFAEMRRHQRDIQHIEQSIKRLRQRYNFTEEEIAECDDFAHLFLHF